MRTGPTPRVTRLREEVVMPRVRVICDGDHAGDLDGLVQPTHHVLSPSADPRYVSRSDGRRMRVHTSPATRWADGDLFAKPERHVRSATAGA